MESSIWLFSYLYSREIYSPLSSFLKALQVLKNGVPLFSGEFLSHCPEQEVLARKYTQSQLQAFLSGLCRAVEKGDLLLYPGHDLFPKEYLYLEEVPFLLRLRGSPVWLGLPGLSVVGHREPSRPSLLWMEEHLAEFFRRQSCFSVSGGARGVDQKAHWLSLQTGRPTVVLLPSGLDCMYPASWKENENLILEAGGAFLSEYPHSQPMRKQFFAQRNRLISGLGRATLVIEARRRSGTLLTAHEAIEQGRPLWILPGHPMDVHMQGSLDLLTNGATPVQDATDLCLLFASEIQDLSDDSPLKSRHLGEGLPGHH